MAPALVAEETLGGARLEGFLLALEEAAKADPADPLEILLRWGNALEPIGRMRPEVAVLLGLSDPQVYSGKAYFLEHHLRRHRNIGVERYRTIGDLLAEPEEVRRDCRRPERPVSYLFLGRYDLWHALVVNVGFGRDRAALYKTFFADDERPYERLPLVWPTPAYRMDSVPPGLVGPGRFGP